MSPGVTKLNCVKTVYIQVKISIINNKKREKYGIVAK